MQVRTTGFGPGAVCHADRIDRLVVGRSGLTPSQANMSAQFLG